MIFAWGCSLLNLSNSSKVVGACQTDLGPLIWRDAGLKCLRSSGSLGSLDGSCGTYF